MFSKSFPCGAVLPQGDRCEEIATVVDIDHIHHEDFVEGRFEQVVDEVQYKMRCPKCGPWQRVESKHRNRTFAEA